MTQVKMVVEYCPTEGAVEIPGVVAKLAKALESRMWSESVTINIFLWPAETYPPTGMAHIELQFQNIPVRGKNGWEMLGVKAYKSAEDGRWYNLDLANRGEYIDIENDINAFLDYAKLTAQKQADAISFEF